MNKILLGCIVDGFTGATDLANNLVRAGMRAIQTIGVPAKGLEGEADAVIVALKWRTRRHLDMSYVDQLIPVSPVANCARYFLARVRVGRGVRPSL